MKIINNVTKNDIEQMLDIYNNSFDLIKTTLDIFKDRLMLNKKNTYVLCETQNDKIIGYSIINNNTIMLLCVDEKHRNKGIGTKLLNASEAEINKNYNKIDLGCGETYLIPGIPLDTKCNYFQWFINRGYENTWTSFDMIIDLKKQHYTLDNGLNIRKANSDERDTIVKVAEEANNWGDIYKKQNIDNIYVAIKDKEMIGLIVVESGHCLFPLSIKNCGIFGCICIKKEYRKHGFGMELLKYALTILQKKNNFCHIGYTYLDWWYSKVGATKYINYAMCEKKLSK